MRILGAILVILGLGRIGMAVWQEMAPNGAAAPVSVARTSAAELRRDSGRTACKVLTVYDGDTLGCDLNGNGRVDRPGEEIRLLGIDSPEMHYSRKNPTHDSAHPVDESFAPEASRWLSERTQRKIVYLEFDARRQDKYDRTLAYIYAGPEDARSLNEQELSQGLATILFLGKNRLHEARFTQVEKEARLAGRGLWSGKK